MKNVELDKNVIMIDTEIKSVKNECENIGKIWKRHCPKCNKEIIHKNKRSWNKSTTLNKICKSCKNRNRFLSIDSIEKIRKTKRLIDYNILERNCPTCNIILKYKDVKYRRNADKKNRLCKECSIKLLHPTKPEYYRKCGICGISIKCARYLKDNNRPCRKCFHVKKNSVPVKEKTKQKLRISYINRMVLTGEFYHPSYNTNACRLIDEYGKKTGYNFQHALNGGEYYIKNLNYWVDGYDKERNIIIEVDEPKHFDKNGNLKSKDIKRMNEIQNNLNCRFIRLKDDGNKYMDLALKKVDN